MEEANKVEFFPTIEEIVNEAPITKCSECGHQFANSSACRFHILKQHSKSDTSGTNEKRLITRSSETPRITMAFYCPDSSCLQEKKWFDGWRNLRQHYFRSHAEKSFVCEMCGFKTGLEKDLNYHRKVRCSWMKKRKSDNPTDGSENQRIKRSRKRKISNPDKDIDDSQPSTSSAGTHTVLQPIYFIVNPENVHSVMETVQKSLNNGIDLVSAEASTQVQMPPYVENGHIPMYATAATSTSFATQYEEEPVTFCERGTMMNEQEPLSYFSPPYGAEFGDMTPQKSQQQFEYSVAASTSSSQPQTRSLGTMFENVTMCNTGTSMIDEASYPPEFLRDIETQTPSFMVQESTSSGSTSTASNDWAWS